MNKRRIVLLLCCLCLAGCTKPVSKGPVPETNTPAVVTDIPVTRTVCPTEPPVSTPSPTPTKEAKPTLADRMDGIPDYSGQFVISIPAYGFEKTTEPFARYSEQDALGRCGMAEALLGQELMPTVPRGEIGMIKPSGWHTVRYDDLIEDKFLYNRCHILGYQLTGNNSVENLITGTRYFNVEGMLPYENQVADYIRRTGNKVHYRVVPVYDNDSDLLCKGVWMEAESVEDNGAGVQFSVFVYNIQPGIWIDYATGDSCREEDRFKEKSYILNTRSQKFHLPECKNVADIAEHNKNTYVGTREDLIEDGYTPCGWCKP